MRITDLEVEGFGVWSGLRIEKLGESLNVLYGPNEAGKTTLLQFLRSMFYGFSPPRRRYLPPVHGGRGGGTIDLAGPHGRFQVGRYDNPLADGSPDEQVTLTAPDGTRQGEHFLKVLLSDIDEPVFNNVFAVGLREIQELATLSDTEAAQLLYNLSVGLDRVSLVDVLRELENSRNRLLDAGGKSCQVVQLLAEREKLRAEIEDLGAINRRYGHLAAEHDQLHQEIIRLEEEANHTEQLARVMEPAVSLRERWTERAALDEQLAALGQQMGKGGHSPFVRSTPGAVPANGECPLFPIERLDAVNANIQKHQQRLDHLGRLREEAKAQFAALPINEALWRQAARIEALKEQEPWITQLQGQIGQSKSEIAELEADLAAERKRLGLGSEAAALPAFSAKMLAPLQSPGKLLRECRQRAAEADQAATVANETAQSLTQQIESALAARGQSDLAAAMDRAGGLVSQFRRRVQLDERLDQLGRYQAELEERSRQLMDRQMLPAGVLVGLGAVFVVGVVLVLAGLLMPASITGSVGWALAVLGLAGTGAAATGKVLLERSNSSQLDGCQKQLSVLQLQVEQAKADRDGLDGQLPRGGGPISSRLQAAEKELAALEELTPLDTRRSAARQEAEAAVRRATAAKEELKAARRRWRQTLAMLGLPEDLSSQQVHGLVQRGDHMAETQRRLGQLREELQRRQRELDGLTARIVQLAADAGVALPPTGPIEQLRQLAETAAQQEASAARRDALRAQARRIRTARAKHEEAVSRLKHRRRELFFEAGVKDEQEFRQRALQFARAEVLGRARDAIDHEIQRAALAADCSESAIRQQLEGQDTATLEARRDDVRQRLAALQQQLHQRLEKRGQLNEQLTTLAADRQLAVKYLDLAMLEKRLEDALHRWQVLATTCWILETIRTTYEQQRQPESLQEASGYLDRLTQGRYHRVWTPLGEHALRVDDAEGHSLPVEVLSRGTREQLFLSLRLALANSYARRGAPLPLILDDVLVNFDAERAKAAATVLRDFAAAGHQLLVFTCHEHIMKLFKTLRVPVSQLPSNAEPGGSIISLEGRDDEKPKRPSEARPSRRKTAAERRKPRPHEDLVEELPEEDPAEDEEGEDDESNEDDSLWERDDEEEDFEDSGGDSVAAA
jgi:uncharacterized protein YhaN